MNSIKDIIENKDADVTSNNIKPEFNALMDLTNRTKQSQCDGMVSFSGTVKHFRTMMIDLL